MASIFTFEPDPPRVESPWLNAQHPLHDGDAAQRTDSMNFDQGAPKTSTEVDREQECTATILKLEAEPQEGPIEYKLHLLLRARRSFIYTSTNHRIPGSLRSGSGEPLSRGTSETRLSDDPPLASSNQSRQHRLQQLTTQLLWRLQQSCPYHASTAQATTVPALPTVAGTISVPQHVGTVISGLEDSKGALYEIGVADDGTFVGLSEDELEESLQNLRAMAATLGCTVEVVRKVRVGDCAWYGPGTSQDGESSATRRYESILWVAEAFVKPNQGGNIHGYGAGLQSNTPTLTVSNQLAGPDQHSGNKAHEIDFEQSSAEQFRLTLAGATTSGKSSLLGCLSSGTLDNGRGKSRLSLLRHRHEIASGLTSSVTQELLGYARKQTAAPAHHGQSDSVRIMNTATAEVGSWHDIHALCRDGKLVFLSDSAGHPRYLRTTIRSLVGWAPHWTLLCISAHANAEDPIVGSQTGLGAEAPILKDSTARTAGSDFDVSEAHLHICLALGLPIIIAITKLDLASRTGLRQVLSRLLTNLKKAGRRPLVVADPLPVGAVEGAAAAQTDSVEPLYVGHVRSILQQHSAALADGTLVPIILTSAVTGAGVGLLHACLHALPIRSGSSEDLARGEAGSETHRAGANRPWFCVEDIFHQQVRPGTVGQELTVVSGVLRSGSIRIGDELLIGPFGTSNASTGVFDPSIASHTDPIDLNASAQHESRPMLVPGNPPGEVRVPGDGRAGVSRSFPGAWYEAQNRLLQGNGSPVRDKQAQGRKLNDRLDTPLQTAAQWCRVRVSSLRNLRMPVRCLRSDQVGTVGLQPVGAAEQSDAAAAGIRMSTSGFGHAIRKGMVLVADSDPPPLACGAVEAEFEGKKIRALSVGSVVVLYTASVRATAKIVFIAVGEDVNDNTRVGDRGTNLDDGDEIDDFPFVTDEDGFDVELDRSATTIVQFRFLTTKEHVAPGTSALILPGGVGSTKREGATGTPECFVGTIFRGLP